MRVAALFKRSVLVVMFLWASPLGGCRTVEVFDDGTGQLERLTGV